MSEQNSLSDIVCQTLMEHEEFLEFTEQIKLTSDGKWKGKKYKATLVIKVANEKQPAAAGE